MNETVPKKRARDGTFRGGARPNSGRPKGIPNTGWKNVGDELRRRAAEVAKLHEQRREERETLPILLRKVTEIERVLKLREPPSPPRPSRRHPLGA
jgi:hypothetical protein